MPAGEEGGEGGGDVLEDEFQPGLREGEGVEGEGEEGAGDTEGAGEEGEGEEGEQPGAGPEQTGED